MMEALLRHDAAAAADFPPVFLVGGRLVDGPALCGPGRDDQGRGVHRERDDPALFGIWNALVTRIIATSSQEFRGAGCQAALHKEFSTCAFVKSGTKPRCANGRVLRGWAKLA